MFKGYAVIDVETTGLRPTWHDRIIEVAILHVDRAGMISDQWCTLINPQRDLGPQGVHGISAAEVRRAPEFRQVAATIARWLSGRVLVGHNLAFDAMFLAAEFDRLGVRTPLRGTPGLCTMRWARAFLPAGTGRSLQNCCQVAGVRVGQAHSALHDARAAAGLLAQYISAGGSPEPWLDLFEEPAMSWPVMAPSASAPVLRNAPGERQPHFLSRIAARLPRVSEPPQADAYLAVLDGALLDRHLSVTEQEALVELALTLGLSRDDLTTLHTTYLDGMAQVAWDDGHLSEAERSDLLSVADLLGIDRLTAERIMSAPRGRASTIFQLVAGDTVAFTGQMQEDRAVWEERARAAGLTVKNKGGVTKATALLVAADPDSLSNNAQKARKYGITIVTETGFARLLANRRKEAS